MSERLQVIASREVSSMVSSWTEFLCVELDAEGTAFRLFTGRYEALDEVHAYINPDTEQLDLPEEIDGKKVVGVEDDYVIGGDLTPFEEDELLSLEDPDSEIVCSWLEAKNWTVEAAAVKYTVNALRDSKRVNGSKSLD